MSNHDLRSDVARFIRREKLLRLGDPVCVAVSGGRDSMVLLHLLRELGHRCSVAHVDHGLRGAESDGDLAFVREHCHRESLPFRSTRVDVAAYASGYGLSHQMAARELRYAWLGELATGLSMPIALAHHGTDAVETLLLGLLRGTGVHGWAGIMASRVPFIRPLLVADGEEVARYADRHHIVFREDSSNTDPKYLRNRVRHELLPLMEALRPGAMRAMARSLDPLRELVAHADGPIGHMAGRFKPNVDGAVRVPFQEIERSGTPLLVLHRLLRHRGFHPELIHRIRDAMLDEATGSVFTTDGWRVNVDRGALLIATVGEEWPAYVIGTNAPPPPGSRFTWRFQEGTGDPPPARPDEALIDASRLDFPLELRPWRHGDRIRPAGLGGSKLVSDILVDAKVPMAEKNGVYVLESAGTVIWVAGHRLAEGYQATVGSTSVLRIARAG